MMLRKNTRKYVALILAQGGSTKTAHIIAKHNSQST
jgi:hypothetical protein